MSEFNNSTCQLPDRSKPPSAHTNTSFASSARPVRPFKPYVRPAIKKPLIATHRPYRRYHNKEAHPAAHSFIYSASHAALVSTRKDIDRMSNSATNSLSSHKRLHTNPNSSDGRALSKSSSSMGGQSPFPRTTSSSALNKVDSRGNGRTESLSSTSLSASTTVTTANSSESKKSQPPRKNVFTRRHGRRYLRDPTLVYPFPCDLPELHRQTLRTILMVQVLGSPVCSPIFQTRAPRRVLEVGCGTGYWSSLCHEHYSRKGYLVSFTGLDIVSVAPPEMSKDTTMKWRFVQHDLRQTRLPFEDEEFDLVVTKDLSFVIPESEERQQLMEEYLRILAPGGALEVWDGDSPIRTLVAHNARKVDMDTSEDVNEDEERARMTGTYIMNQNIPFLPAQNQYLADYSGWVLKAMNERNLTTMPCAHVSMALLQEEGVTNVDCRRVVIPLSEIRWEREGIGSAESSQTGDTSKGKSLDGAGEPALTAAQAALRHIALLTVVQQIEALEPVLRDASGKSQDEWDRWAGLMKFDLLSNNGANSGECLEVGAWWATKKKAETKPVLKKPSTLANRGVSSKPTSAAGSMEQKSPSTAGSRRRDMLDNLAGMPLGA